MSHRSSHVVYLDQNKRVRVSVCVFRLGVCLRPDTRNRLQYIKNRRKMATLSFGLVAGPRKSVWQTTSQEKRKRKRSCSLFFVCVCVCQGLRAIASNKSGQKSNKKTRNQAKGKRGEIRLMFPYYAEKSGRPARCAYFWRQNFARFDSTCFRIAAAFVVNVAVIMCLLGYSVCVTVHCAPTQLDTFS